MKERTDNGHWKAFPYCTDERLRTGRPDTETPSYTAHAFARQLRCGPNAARVGNRAHDRRTKCLRVGFCPKIKLYKSASYDERRGSCNK